MSDLRLPGQSVGPLWYCSVDHTQSVRIPGKHTLKPYTKDFPGAWLSRKQFPWLPEWHRYRASLGMWRRCSSHGVGTGLWGAFTLSSLSIIYKLHGDARLLWVSEELEMFTRQQKGLRVNLRNVPNLRRWSVALIHHLLLLGLVELCAWAPMAECITFHFYICFPTPFPPAYLHLPFLFLSSSSLHVAKLWSLS